MSLEPTPTPPPTAPRRSLWHRLRHFDLRETRWALLDAWETRPRFRHWSYGLAAGVLVLALAGIWGLPWWQQRNALKIARGWLDAGRLDYAAEAVHHALTTAPQAPAAWQLAAEWAERSGRAAEAVDYARQAAELAPDRPELTLDWAATALNAAQPAEVARALASLPDSTRDQSGRAQRIAGELARRQQQYAEACKYFEASIRLEQAQPFNEIPLGTVLLCSSDPAYRQRGLALLGKWAGQREEGGMMALRALVQDALTRQDLAALREWTPRLRLHPRCTLGDMPLVLGALSLALPENFENTLADLLREGAKNPALATQVISWLNQVGQSPRAAAFGQSLAPEVRHRAPIAVVLAEALRQTADWPALAEHTASGEWGGDTDFLRWAYGYDAARQLDQAAQARQLWQTLLGHARLHGPHALFAADTLYVWGRVTEAVELLWLAAEEPHVGYLALGTLARHYQQQRDGDGQYRAFRQLHGLRPTEPDIANNYAYFAALMGQDNAKVLALARAQHESQPAHPAYRATYAFVLARQHRPTDALNLLQPVLGELPRSEPLRFAYGIALATAGKTAEARPYLETAAPELRCTAETALIATLLK